MAWALFYNMHIASKAHPHKRTAMMEAFERGLVTRGTCAKDGLITIHSLERGYELREIRDESPNNNKESKNA